MEFMKLVKERFSVRSFSDQPIEQKKLDSIIEAAKYAPTAANLQSQKVYILKSKEAVNKVNEVCKCIYGAPVVLLICYDETKAWKNPFSGKNSGEEDASIVATHMMLEAWNIGIGSCWVGMYDSKAVCTQFDLPENIKLVCMLPIGYMKEGTVPYEKWHGVYKPMEDIIVEL